MTKAMLEQENAELKAQVEVLTLEVSKLVSAVPSVRVTKVPPEVRLNVLTKGQPHQQMTCEIHGSIRANRFAVCPTCFCVAMGKPTTADSKDAKSCQI